MVDHLLNEGLGEKKSIPRNGQPGFAGLCGFAGEWATEYEVPLWC